MNYTLACAAMCDEYLKIASEVAGAAKDHPKSDVALEVAKKYPHLVGHHEEKKTAGVFDAVKGGLRSVGQHLHNHEDAYELAGLGALAVPGLDSMQAHLRAGPGASEHQIAKKRLLGENAHAAIDVGGLGVLAAPIAAKKMLGH
jgi:hypothetical protein